MYDLQASLGATFTEFWGWVWTDSFGDVQGEHRAIREGVGMADVSSLIKWDWRGPDAVKAAQRVHSNNILGLEIGQVRYGAFLDEKGRMVDDGTVYKLADDHCWVMTNTSGLTDYFTEAVRGLDVEFEDITDRMPLIQVQGPRSRELVSKLTDSDLSRLGYFRFLPHQIRVGDVPAWISRTGFTGELGYELFVAPEYACDLFEAVHRAGATPYGAAVADIQRLESGIVVYELDYQPGVHTPYDVSFDRLVALDKVDFLGKDALLEVARNPPYRMKTLLLETDEIPGRWIPVQKDGGQAGTLTSPTRSPQFGVIALAMLEAPFSQSGETLEIGNHSAVRATVDGPCLYDPEKLRPRS
jgi:aminomethyltransferase